MTVAQKPKSTLFPGKIWALWFAGVIVEPAALAFQI